jgi:methylphosphotriester-DNA--protein-cysteine methyltransferase
MDEPEYAEFAPRAALRDFVHCLWMFSAPEDAAPQPIAPDGRPELIVHTRKSYDEVGDGAARTQAPVIFAGQLTKPLTLAAQADVLVFGVRFRPDGARGFLGFDLDAATDKRIDLAVEHGDAVIAALRGALRAESRVEARLALIEDYVETRIAASGRSVDAIVRAAVTALLAGEEPATAEISERQLQRRFKAEVGVSPRELQSVLRFRRVFDEIDRPGPPGWVEAALAAGYFDQPQMARDFRRYLGMSSRHWAMQRAGLARALTSETYKKRRPE